MQKDRDDSLRSNEERRSCYLKEDPSESSEERGLHDLVKKHSERPEAATQKVQKTVMIPQAQYSVRDRERGDASFQLEADMR